jgi:hypothetical protein
MACGENSRRTPKEERLERMHPQSTDGWALRLHSCRALSSQPQDQLKTKMKNLKIYPLTNHIPVFRGSKTFFKTQILLELGRE